MNPFDSTQLRALLRRNIFSTVCSGLSLVLAVAIWWLWQDVHILEIENRERAQQFAAMLSTMKTGPLVRQELARAQDIVQRIEGNLVIERNLAENLWYFYKIHPDSKEILTTLRPLNSEASADGSDYKLVPFSLQLNGTYEQVASYLLQLETGPRLAMIKSFKFERQQKSSSGLILYLEVKLLGKK
jgi:Tfp pilus assembly protein PilO